MPDKQVLSDLDAAVTWAGKSGVGDISKLAVTGFCWGGRIVWLYAAHNSNLKAGVAWYGRLDSQKDELHPTQPIDLVGELKAPVLGLYGGGTTKASRMSWWPRCRRSSKQPASPLKLSFIPTRPTDSMPITGRHSEEKRLTTGGRSCRSGSRSTVPGERATAHPRYWFPQKPTAGVGVRRAHGKGGWSCWLIAGFCCLLGSSSFRNSTRSASS